MDKQQLIEKIIKILGHPGRMIAGSKGGYSHRYKDNLPVFNANLVTKERGKLWHGDIDVTVDCEALRKIGRIVGTDLYVLYEMNARFDNENKPNFSKPFAIINKDKIIMKRHNDQLFVFSKGITPTRKPLEPNKQEAAELKKQQRQYEKEQKIEFERETIESSYKAFKLPKISIGNKKRNPLEIFCDNLVKKYGKDFAEQLFSNGYVTKTFEKELEKAVINWFNKHQGIPKKSYEMQKIKASLCWSTPKSFRYDLKWMKSNMIYISSADIPKIAICDLGKQV